MKVSDIYRELGTEIVNLLDAGTNYDGEELSFDYCKDGVHTACLFNESRFAEKYADFCEGICVPMDIAGAMADLWRNYRHPLTYFAFEDDEVWRTAEGETAEEAYGNLWDE